MQKIWLFLPVLFLIACGNDTDTTENTDSNIVKQDSVQIVKQEMITVLIDRLRLREHPTLKAKILDNIPEKDQVIFLNETTDYKDKIKIRNHPYNEPWYKVKYNDKIGWVYGGGVSKRQKEASKKGLSLRTNLSKIQFKGVTMVTYKATLLGRLGQPDSIEEPKYDCGPFSEDWQGKKFYQYFYEDMNFIVYNDTAEIQNIDFTTGLEMTINGVVINGDMNLETVSQALGLNPADAKNNLIIIYPTKEDYEGYFFLEFRGGKLIKFDRYEPC